MWRADRASRRAAGVRALRASGRGSSRRQSRTALDLAALTPESARVLAAWAGLAPDRRRIPELIAVFQAFRERVQRLHRIDVDAVEFDFLRPMDERR